MPHNHRALIVCINNYPGIGPLQGAERDGEKFRRWLESPTGGNFASDEDKARIQELYSNPAAKLPSDGTPLKADVEKFVQKLREEAKLPENKEREFPLGDRMYLMFSGHGFHNQYRQSAVYMANATVEDTGFSVVARDLWEFLCMQQWFREVILISDACRTHTPYAKQITDPYQATSNGQGVKGVAFLASAPGLETVERPVGPNGEVGGVLTHAILRGLSGLAVKRKLSKRITSEDLETYVRNAMVADFGESFRPVVEPHGKAFVIASGVEQIPCSLTLKAKSATKPVQVVLYDDKDHEEGSFDLAQGPVTLTLPAGLYYPVVNDVYPEEPILLFRESVEVVITP